MKKIELLCPQCKNRTPIIEKLYMSEMKTPMLKLTCPCSMKKDNTVDLDDYLSFLNLHRTKMRFCFKHEDQKAQIFCKDCSLYMCNLCFSYHMSFNPLHQIQTPEANRKVNDMCLIHITRTLDYYCENCNQNICFECIRLSHANHPILQLQEYWDKTERKIGKWKDINFNQFISKHLTSFSEVVQTLNDKISTLIFNLQQAKAKLEHGTKKVHETNMIISAFIKIVFDDFNNTKSSPHFEIIQNANKIHFEELLTSNEENIFNCILKKLEEDIRSLSHLGKSFLNKTIVNLKSDMKGTLFNQESNVNETPLSLALYVQQHQQQQQLKQKDIESKFSLSFSNNQIFDHRSNQHNSVLNQLNCISQYNNNNDSMSNSNSKIFNKDDILKTLNIQPNNNNCAESLDLYLSKKRYEQNNNVQIEHSVKYIRRIKNTNSKIKIPMGAVKMANKKAIFSVTIDKEKKAKREQKMKNKINSQLEKANKNYLLSTSDDYLRSQTQSTEQQRLNILQLHSGYNESESIPHLTSDDNNNYNKLLFGIPINDSNLKEVKNQSKDNCFFNQMINNPQLLCDYSVINKYEQCLFTINEHSTVINSLIQLRDGQLVSGGNDGIIYFFSPNENYLCKLKIDTLNEAIECLIELIDRNIAVGFKTNSIKIFVIQNPQCIKTFTGHTKKITSIVQRDMNTLISSSEDTTIKLWDIPSMTCLMTLNEHFDTINDILLSNQLILSASGDATMKIWNYMESPSIFTFKGHFGSINKIIQIPNNKSNIIISASSDKRLKVWDILNRKCISTLIGHTDQITLAIYLLEESIASASIDFSIKIWNIQNMHCVKTLFLNQKITSIVELYNGLIATGTEDKTIKLWL